MALKALELDENLGHAALGAILWSFDWDWPAAEREFKRALELNPGSAAAHYVYGNYLATVGREAESIAEHRRALELDPLSSSTNWGVALDSLRSSRYDEAIEQFLKMLDLESENLLALMGLSTAYYFKGLPKESFAAVKKQFESRKNEDVVAALENGYEQSGFTGAMLSAAAELANQSDRRYFPAALIAEAYAYAEENDQAAEWLERAFDERDPFLLFALRWGIVHDRLQSDPRFQDIVRRMNFPE